MDRYRLIDKFPENSYTKNQISVIAQILEDGVVNPLRVLYNDKDLKSNETVEDIIENLAFNYADSLKLFLEYRSDYISSRRMNDRRLAEYMRDELNYDPSMIGEFKDDSTVLYLLLFAECYDSDNNYIDLDRLYTAVAASHKFRSKRDRMTTIPDDISFTDIMANIKNAESRINGSLLPTKIHAYHNRNMSTVTVVFHQVKKYASAPVVESYEDSVKLRYETRPNVRQTALQFSQTKYGTKIQSYHSVTSWQDTFDKFMQSTIGESYAAQMSDTESQLVNKIINDIKDRAESESVTPITVNAAVNEHINGRIQSIPDHNIDNLEELLSDVSVIGVVTSSDQSSFEIRSSNGITELPEEYQLSSSLTTAITSARRDEITVYVSVDTSGKPVVFSMNDGEWRIKSGENDKVLQGLETVF